MAELQFSAAVPRVGEQFEGATTGGFGAAPAA